MKQFIGFCVLILTLTTADGNVAKPDCAPACSEENANKSTTNLISEDKFFYFAYGSNLLESRLHIQNPSAKFYDKARLPGYRLDFNITFPGFWNGAAATIAKDPLQEVWGALWVMDKSEMDKIDDQEGVSSGWYHPLNVTVTTPDNKQILARTYKEFVDPPPKDPSKIELERWPSSTYHQVILTGALNLKLPTSYIEWLYKFNTNGKHAEMHLIKKLGYPFFY